MMSKCERMTDVGFGWWGFNGSFNTIRLYHVFGKRN